MDEETFREKYIEMQVLDQHIKQAQKQLDQLEEQVAEANYIIECLEQMKNVKKGDEILVPVANGIFLTAKVEDSTKMLVNVGTDTIVTKTVSQTQKMLADQTSEIQETQYKLATALQQFTERAKSTEEEIRNLMGN